MEMFTIKGENVLTRDEVASLLKVHATTISRWAKSGIIRSHKIGGRRLFLESDVWSLFEKHLTW
jgi:excisionase family DNA binding protein